MTTMHVTTKVIAHDEYGTRYERNYVGQQADAAMTDFTQLLESDGSCHIVSITGLENDKCVYATYDDYVEAYCTLCNYT